MIRPPILYSECIVISPNQVSDFTWSGVSSGCPAEITPTLLLNGNYAVPAVVSTMPGLPQDFRDRLIIARGPMNTGSNEVIPKYYMDTVILSCCDFVNHTNFHRNV